MRNSGLLCVSGRPWVPVLFMVGIIILMSCHKKAVVMVYPSTPGSKDFPEEHLDLPQTGVCFSGGGTRAMTAAIGQMRGLRTLGLWDNIGYLSCVSGGSWASTIFTYYQDGALSDDHLLGDTLYPSSLTLKVLGQMDEGFMGKVVTNSLIDDLLKRLAVDRLSLGLLQKSDFLWIDGIGHTYLKPYGLYDPEHPKYFTLDEASRNDIIRRNPHLTPEDFILVHRREGDSHRPYLIINSSVVAPADDLPLSNKEHLSVFNYTPLYLGSNQALTVKDTNSLSGDPVQFQVGGGFIEPFGFGSGTPKLNERSGDTYEVTVDLPEDRYSIVEATGTSSSAFGAVASSHLWIQLPTEILFGFTADQLLPEESYWAIDTEGSILPSRKFRFTDGGNLENYGLITLLQRGVKRIVVFINTSTSLNTDILTCEGIPPQANDVDSDLFPFFGYPSGDLINNQVFDKVDFDTVYQRLRRAKLAGGTVMARTQLTTVENTWWGIPAGQKADILWVYNDQVAKWECQLPGEVLKAIGEGNGGPFKDFPNYELMFESGFPRIQELTVEQVNLLYHLSAWNVYSNADVFREMFPDE